MPGPSSQPTYRAPRLFVEADLAEGAILPLARDHARYLMTVLRRGQDDPVRLFNGRDGEWLARLTPGGRDRADLAIERRLRPQPPAGAGPWLLLAAIKRGPMEIAVEKATELGVARILPVRTRRSNTERLNLDRLDRIAREAAEQSERLDAPGIDPLAPLDDVLAAWPADRLLIAGDESGAAPPALAAFQGLAPTPFGLLVGPEGGFAPDELDGLARLAFVRRIGLGPRVLRAETAVVVGLALAQAAIGDLAAARSGAGVGNEHGGAT